MNIRFLRKIARYILPWRFEFKLPDQVIDDRNRIVIGSSLKYFTIDEIKQVLTNRRSDFSDSAVISDFFGTEQPHHEIPVDDCFIQAIKYVTDINRPPYPLYPIAYPDLRYYPWHLPVSAEAPWNINDFKFVPFVTAYDWHDDIWTRFKNKISKYFRPREWLRYKQAIGMITDDSPTFHNLYNEIFVYNRALVHGIKYGSRAFWTEDGHPIPYYWNTLHSRSHVVSADEPDKIRAVFGATKLFLQVENCFIWQIQRSRLNDDVGNMLWGREIMKGGWKKLKREIECQGAPNTVLAIDWSQWDKRLLFQLIDIVHAIWKTYFDFSQYQPTSYYPNGKPKDINHIERLWKWMCHCVKHTPILLPDGRLFKWTYNGFGSGYQQTQVMDSDANSIVILTCLCAMGINIWADGFWIRVQGDDSLVSFFERAYDIYGPAFLQRLADCAMYYFNAKLNVKKSKIGKRLTGMTVLGYFNINGIPYREEEDLLRHLFFPERDQDWTRLAASAIGIAMADCGRHERIYNLCYDIWFRLVKIRKVTPRFSALRWMERAGMIERAEALSGSEFPKRIHLTAQTWGEPTRDESAKQRLWPTKPGPAGNFYFISPAP